MNSERPCIFGEVLFDEFPDGAHVLGGAPFNVAWHLQAFGQAPCFVSRIGEDAAGLQIQAAMSDWGMDVGFLQTDPRLPTGRVKVTLKGGEPSYDIVRPVAYDAIDPGVICDRCELLYHGSLAVRDSRSADALQRQLAAGPRRVFVDINLRAPWWEAGRVVEMIRRADWLKINADELAAVDPTAGHDVRSLADFTARYDLRGVIVTRGSAGARLYERDAGLLDVAPVRADTVVDTVGAGDAFAAVFILGLLRDWPLQTTLERAQAFASRIVANRGAIMTRLHDYQPFVDDWDLAN
jgi:fructokinase